MRSMGTTPLRNAYGSLVDGGTWGNVRVSANWSQRAILY
jgi:hypothetical protein